MDQDPLSNISVVLVETQQAGNIGSAARAMKNMGLSRLKLVQPASLLNLECRKMAAGAIKLVSQAELYSTFEEAVAQDNLVVGTTSSRKRKVRQRLYTPRQVAPLVYTYAESNQVAIVFGPENRGLTDAQLAQCQHLVSVPAHSQQPVLNVAQTVMILGYEISTVKDVTTRERFQLASHSQREQMFRHMEQVLSDIGFLSSQNPAHIMRAIKSLLGQADLAPRDVQIIRGILSQMDWYIQKGYRLSPEKVLKQ